MTNRASPGRTLILLDESSLPVMIIRPHERAKKVRPAAAHARDPFTGALLSLKASCRLTSDHVIVGAITATFSEQLESADPTREA